jgi:hypothetical protein
MKNLANIFTKERVVFGIVMSLIGLAGTVYTARSEASGKVQEDLNAFKVQTIGEIGELNGKMDGMNRQLEFIQGLSQSIDSRLDNLIDKR